MNPSAVALASSFELDVYYRDGELAEKTRENFLGITILDNSLDVVLPGALTYLQGRRTFKDLPSVDEQFIQASLGKFYSNNLSFGFGIVRLSQEVETGEKFMQWDGILGAAYHISSSASVGLSYSYFANPASKIPVHLRLAPTVGLGLRYNFKQVVEGRLDISRQEKDNPDKKGVIGLGVETYASKFLHLMIGGKWDDYNQRRFVTTGLSFKGPKLQVTYSFEKNIDLTRAAVHGVDIRMPF